MLTEEELRAARTEIHTWYSGQTKKDHAILMEAGKRVADNPWDMAAIEAMHKAAFAMAKTRSQMDMVFGGMYVAEEVLYYRDESRQ